MVEMDQENKGNEVRQGEKMENLQPQVNESITDEDSIFKFLSFSGMLEKKRREEFPKDKEKKIEAAYGVHSFEEFYKTELANEAKREKKREYKMDPEEYEPKKHLQKKLEREGAEEDKERLGFRSTKQKEADFFKDFEKFKENKSIHILFIILILYYRGAIVEDIVVLYS